MKRTSCTAVVCVLLLVGWTSGEQVNKAASFGQGKDDIFIDEPAQADAVEGSAVDEEVSDNDHDEASGLPPDDEDSAPGSGFTDEDGSGIGPIPSTTDKSHHIMLSGKLPTTTTTTTTTRKPIVTIKAAVPTLAEIDNKVPEETSPPKTGKTSPPPANEETNDVGNDVGRVMGQKAEDRQASFFAQPGILAAVIGGAVVGLLCAILLVMFIVYRMRKKDEGSYPLDEPKRSPTVNSYTRNTKEFYA